MHIQPQRCIPAGVDEEAFPTQRLDCEEFFKVHSCMVSRDPSLLILERVYVFLAMLVGVKVDSLKSQACGYFLADALAR